ncbi:1-deoxy-D-xylulose 5-phosphate reductoisomerase [Poriferisphaera corsica]|uniref:1-deoxy-D-xylulose 5-phosphate reductoisomerase n=1 Tax=Poriferisphaera corsica TaxID=2528020 RepID=A0A517YVA9_9BACT|nr:1-deoxy-D-xylulose-5-phosphate reductoisomerase [Poriferisphaera corsica]QDU34168.1 1-deoxy-D-xylulose 5-phosphate reductoisomerase [Poriferisphaera corsica]
MKANRQGNAGKRKLIVLGSSGSIGENTLKVVEHLNAHDLADIDVVGLAVGRRVDVLIEQAKRFGVKHVAVGDESQVEAVKDALPGIQVFGGEFATKDLVEAVEATDLAAAVVGSAGLPATMAAIERGMRISLANKETLVAAGELVSPLVREHGAELLPVDSEHSAIFQCLHDHPNRMVKRIVLTASGGPFRTWEKETIEAATVEQALKHPTWEMGQKITIDSASMMNKALEIIEAHWLFDLPGEQIDVIVHPQSVIHSFVEFVDNSVLAQLGPPDMKTPIQYALTYPERGLGGSEKMDWRTLSQLTFEGPDVERFGSLKLAYSVIEAGGTAGAIFNAANEAAVAAFLGRQIPFGQITRLVTEALSAIESKPVDSLETVMEADQKARAYVDQQIGQYDANGVL